MAAFGVDCAGLTCTFADASTDDGGVVGWSWDFGDGSAPSTETNPSHTYGAEGTYTVALTVTDAEGLTDTATRDVTVTDGGSGGAPTLDDPVATRISGPWAYADLTWTAGTGSVDVYRGAQLVATTTSSTYSDRVGRKSEVAGQTFTYTVCLAGTGTCSNAATASF